MSGLNIFSKKNEIFTTCTNSCAASAIYKEVVKYGENNFLISPLSIEIMIAVAQSGAKGQTAEELRASLHLPNDQKQINAAFQNSIRKLKSTEKYSFNNATKLYLNENLTIKSDFKKVVRNVFQADVENIEFSQGTKAAEKINKWVENQTHHKIKNIINSYNVSKDLKAVLINAIYFQGSWKYRFSKSDTTKAIFHGIDGTDSETDFMIMETLGKTFTFKYCENKELDAKFLELPFLSGGKVSMIIILPNQKEGIFDLEQRIDKIFLPQDFTDEYVEIFLPKFKTESQINLKQILQNLGVDKAFKEEEADFSRVSDEILYLDNIVQKTFIDVNEDGVIAAAVTEEEWIALCAHESKSFIADHSFIYYIKIADLIVFVGRVVMPTQ